MKMARLDDLSSRKTDIFNEIKRLISKTEGAIRDRPSNLTEGIDIVERLRRDIYEDLNQIPHKAMIVRAANLLSSTDYRGKVIEWYWNPKQTGSKKEPDLRGKIAGKTAINAEITTSEKPDGGDKKIAYTLRKLDGFSKKCRKIYFVRTETMKQRAETKKARNKRYKKIEIKVV